MKQPVPTQPTPSSVRTAASKIVQLISQFFFSTPLPPVTPYTTFMCTCDSEQAWAFEQLVELFPEDERGKPAIMGRVEILCDQCSYCAPGTEAPPHA